jgi:hypothetical protein
MAAGQDAAGAVTLYFGEPPRRLGITMRVAPGTREARMTYLTA